MTDRENRWYCPRHGTLTARHRFTGKPTCPTCGSPLVTEHAYTS